MKYKVSECQLRNAYMVYNRMYEIYNMYMCHIRTTQALAWVRMALPRGLVCHVASTWVPFFNFLIVFKRFKLKNKFKKIQKNP